MDYNETTRTCTFCHKKIQDTLNPIRDGNSIGTGYGSIRLKDIGPGYGPFLERLFVTHIHANPDDMLDFCYACCAEIDKHQLRMLQGTAKYSLYLSHGKETKYVVTNWPGTLSLPVAYSTESKTNWGHQRIDVWFRFEERWYHGRNQNLQSNELLHVNHIKNPPR